MQHQEAMISVILVCGFAFKLAACKFWSHIIVVAVQNKTHTIPHQMRQNVTHQLLTTQSFLIVYEYEHVCVWVSGAFHQHRAKATDIVGCPKLRCVHFLRYFV